MPPNIPRSTCYEDEQEDIGVKFVHVFFRYVSMLENILCTLGLFATTFIAFFQVINRYWLRLEIIWLNDLGLFIFILFMFFAIPLTTRENEHTGVDVFVKRFFRENSVGSKSFNLMLKAVAIGTVIVFLLPAWSFAKRAYKYPQYATLVRWFNTSWLMEMLFGCMVLCLLHLIYDFLCGLAEMRKTANPDREGEKACQ